MVTFKPMNNFSAQWAIDTIGVDEGWADVGFGPVPSTRAGDPTLSSWGRVRG